MRERIRRRTIMIAGAAAVVLALAAMVPARAAEVRIGTANTSSDVGFFIAAKKGYFAEEGIQPTFISFDSAAKMIAPLGTGQLEVGGGAPSSALYNAVGRGIGVKIVADKGSTPPGHGLQPLLVRKDLFDSGKVKDFKDLKGLKVASGATGISTSVTLNEALKRGGLTYKDVDVVNMGYPQHVLALENKAVDAALTVEPSATLAIKKGAAVKLAGDDDIYPNHQLAVVIYGRGFIESNPDLARKFMRAYIRAARFYNDALEAGRIGNSAKAEELLAILVEYTLVKDAELYRAITMHGTNPDGRLNVASLQKDFEFFKEQGLIEGQTSVEQVTDQSFVEAALKELGPYVRAAK